MRKRRGGNLVFDAMIQKDHAIGNIFFQAVPGQRPFAALGGDDRGEAAILKPAEQAAEFSAQNSFV
jgi:hypothetical protein